MADTRPTKLSLLYKIYLCFLAIFCPKQLIEEEKKDTEKRNSFSGRDEREHNAYVVNRAFWSSLGLILFFGFLGIMCGLLLYGKFNKPSPIIIIIFQSVGASLLLLGTLFVRGWQIQTFCSVTLSERVNLWIYRSLYCVGTSILISSIVWSFI